MLIYSIFTINFWSLSFTWLWHYQILKSAAKKVIVTAILHLGHKPKCYLFSLWGFPFKGEGETRLYWHWGHIDFFFTCLYYSMFNEFQVIAMAYLFMSALSILNIIQSYLTFKRPLNIDQPKDRYTTLFAIKKKKTSVSFSRKQIIFIMCELINS